MADNPMDILSSLLSNPEAIKNIGKMLNETTMPSPPVPAQETSDEISSMPDLSGFSVSEDNGTRLLYALEPYLSSKRRGNISQIVQAVKVGKMINGISKRK